MALSSFVSTSDLMKTVKSALDTAPEGAKKAAALSHFKAAKQALGVKDDAETVRELEAAADALA